MALNVGPENVRSRCFGMMARFIPNVALVGAAMLAGCAGDPIGSDEPVVESRSGATPAPPSSLPTAMPRADEAWGLASSGEGTALLFPESGETSIRLFCPAGQNRILINVPSFRAIPSEERLTFGSGDAAEAVVADTRGDRLRGGVSASGKVPDNLAALIRGPISAVYGSQRVGPHPAPAKELARDFSTACSDRKPSKPGSATASGTNACLMQDGSRLSVAPLRGLGTEPFWGVKVDGRCVTYSHPDDQQGTRVWTRYTEGATGGTWTGALGGRPFVLRTRKQPGCSDGMSDRLYPLAIELTVGSEQRSGCAAPG